MASAKSKQTTKQILRIMKKNIILFFAVVLTLGLSAQTVQLNRSSKCDAATQAGIIQQTAAKDNAEIRLLAKVSKQFDAQQLRSRGIVAGAKAGDIVALRVPASQLGYIDQCPEVLQYSLSYPMAPTMDRTVRDTRTDSVHAGAGGLPQGYTGAGVIVGITDWGFDYRHINYNNKGTDNFRLLRAWDQFKLSGPTPAGFDYGTVYNTRAELIAAKGDTNNIYDIGTHGTHVAGIAAGRGVEGRYVGEAPDANLLFCTFKLDAVSWMDAVAWMISVAREEGKRLVINSSWGMYTLGPIDGTSLLSQAINNWAVDSNVVFVTSGGNCGDDMFHVARTFSAGTPDTLTTSPSYFNYTTAIGQSVFMWGEPNAAFQARMGIASDSTVNWTPWYNTAEGNFMCTDSVLGIAGSGNLAYEVTVEQSNTFNNRPHIHFNIGIVNTSHANVLLQYTADEGTVHAWNVVNLQNGAGNMGTGFTKANHSEYELGNNDCGIGEPACAERCITVAAHNPDSRKPDGTLVSGAIATFSSHGPVIDGRRKPDVSAPGVQVVSSINSRTTETGYSPTMSYTFAGTNYTWSRMSGTSMSGPAVTGICALLLEANPSLTPMQVREILCTTARNDTATGPLHASDSLSDIWGYGKVDALAAVNEALCRVDISTADEQWFAKSLQLYPNPATSRVTILTGRSNPEQVVFYAIDGRRVMEQTITREGSVSLAELPRGIYVVRCGARTAKLVVQN